MNEKTKLGLSAAFFAAGLYAVGFFGLTPLLLMAGYTLIMEESDFLKRAAVKSMTIVLLFEVVDLVVSLFDGILGLISLIISLFGSFSLAGLINFMDSGVSLLKLVCVIICILAATKGKDAKIPIIDGLADKIMGVAPVFSQQVTPQYQQSMNNQFAQQQMYQQQPASGYTVKFDSDFSAGTPAQQESMGVQTKTFVQGNSTPSQNAFQVPSED